MKMFTVKNLKKLSVVVCALGIFAGAVVLPVKAMARSFADAALQEKQLSALLWAADGINRPESGKRVHPTTRGIYNIDVYAVMAGGIYKYDPETHALHKVSPVDFRPQINAKQTFVHTAPLTLFFVSVRGSVDKAAFAKAAGLSKEQTVLISQTIGVLP